MNGVNGVNAANVVNVENGRTGATDLTEVPFAATAEQGRLRIFEIDLTVVTHPNVTCDPSVATALRIVVAYPR